MHSIVGVLNIIQYDEIWNECIDYNPNIMQYGMSVLILIQISLISDNKLSTTFFIYHKTYFSWSQSIVWYYVYVFIYDIEQNFFNEKEIHVDDRRICQ